MKRITYSKFTGDDFGISSEDLMRALSEFLLQSGFQSQFGFSEWDQNSLEELRRAIEEALERGELFDPADAQRMQEAADAMRQAAAKGKSTSARWRTRTTSRWNWPATSAAAGSPRTVFR